MKISLFFKKYSQRRNDFQKSLHFFLSWRDLFWEEKRIENTGNENSLPDKYNTK